MYRGRPGPVGNGGSLLRMSLGETEAESALEESMQSRKKAGAGHGGKKRGRRKADEEAESGAGRIRLVKPEVLKGRGAKKASGGKAAAPRGKSGRRDKKGKGNGKKDKGFKSE